MSSRINFHPLLLLLEASAKKDVKEIIAVTSVEDAALAVSTVTDKLGCDERQAQNLLVSLRSLIKKLNEQEETYEARAAIFPESFHPKLRDLLIKLTAIRSSTSERSSSVSTSEAGSDVGGSDRDSGTGVVRIFPESNFDVPVGKPTEEEVSFQPKVVEPLSTASSQVDHHQDGEVYKSQDVDQSSIKVQKPPVPSRVKPPIAARKPVIAVKDDRQSTQLVEEDPKVEEKCSDPDAAVTTMGPQASSPPPPVLFDVISSFPRLHDFKCNLVHEDDEQNDGSDPRLLDGTGTKGGIRKKCSINLDLIHARDGKIHRQEVSLTLSELDQTIQRLSLIKNQLFNKLAPTSHS